MELNGRDIEPLEWFIDDRTVLTIGVFDGVHLGHQHLIRRAVARARERRCLAAVLTFYPHPRLVLRPDSGPVYLTSLDDKMDLLRGFGLDFRLLLHFDPTVATLSAEDFLKMLRKRINLCEIWVGPDFALGRKREGDILRLRQIGLDQGFKVETVLKYQIDGEPVSSTAIRNRLAAGDVRGAARYLGRPPRLVGKVGEGFRRGRQIGFPTANLEVDKNTLLPADGVYAVCVGIGDTVYPGVTNIGVRPSFDGGHRTVETYIIGFSGDLYGQRLVLNFQERLRGETKFDSVKALVDQIEKDIARARDVLTTLGCI